MKTASIALAVALLVTNAWWLYKGVDHGVTDMYREVTCTEHEEALVQSLAIVRLAKGRKARKEIVDAARAALPQFGEPFEKDGEVIVGQLAFKFDREGALIDVRTTGANPATRRVSSPLPTTSTNSTTRSEGILRSATSAPLNSN